MQDRDRDDNQALSTSLHAESEGTAIELPPPPDYDPDEYPSLDLLCYGEIATWLRQREATLGKRARENRLDAESAKTVGFGLMLATGVMASTNPIAWIPFFGALAGYAMTLFQEKQLLDRTYPMPFYRGSLFDVLHGFQNGGVGMTSDRTDFENKASYLNSEENAEYFLLGAYLDQLGAALAHFPPYVRFDAYRYWVTRFWRVKTIAPTEEVKSHIMNSVNQDRLNWKPPKVKFVPQKRQNPFEALPHSDKSDPFSVRQIPAAESADGVGANTKLTAIEVSPNPVTIPPGVIDQAVEAAMMQRQQSSYEEIADGFDGVDFIASDPTGHLRFDWKELVNGDLHPMLAIVAPMDGGKSRLTKWLAKHVLFGELPDRSNIAVLDVMGADWEWNGCQLIRDYHQMVYLMACDITAQQVRLEAWQRRRPGQEPDDLFIPMLRVLEEFTATLPALKAVKPFRLPDKANEKVKAVFAKLKTPAAIVDQWKLNHGSITRKLRSRAIFISTELVADAFDMSAGKRSSMTLIFPGVQGIALVMNDTAILKLGTKQNQPLREQLIAEAGKYRRSALVYSHGRWMIAEIPELDERGDVVGQAPPARPNRTNVRSPAPTQQGATQAIATLPVVTTDTFNEDDNDNDEPGLDESTAYGYIGLIFKNSPSVLFSARDIARRLPKKFDRKQDAIVPILKQLFEDGYLERIGNCFKWIPYEK